MIFGAKGPSCRLTELERTLGQLFHATNWSAKKQRPEDTCQRAQCYLLGKPRSELRSPGPQTSISHA